MAVNDDDERFWSLVWPKLEAGTWRFELQSKRARVATVTLGTEDSSNVIVSCMGDDDGASTSSGEAGRSVAAGMDKGARGGYNDDNSGDRKTTLDDLPSRKYCHVPVFFPPPRGAASEALEEAMRRNLPADGSAGAERPDRFEGVDAVIELLTQVPGFPAAMTFGTAPNMDAVAAAAEAVSARPHTHPKSTAHRSAKSTERLAPRFPALSTGTNEPQVPRSESSTLTNVSTRHGRIIRKPVKLEVNPGRQALIGRNGKPDVISAGAGGAGRPERCVARLGTAANASGLKRASSGCQSWAGGDRSGCANIAGRRTGDGAAGDCSGGGDRAGSRSGGGGSATDGRVKCNGGLRSSSGGVGQDACEHGGYRSHVGRGTSDGGASGSSSTGISTGPGGAEEGVNGTLGPKSTNVAWVIPCPPPERPVGSLGDDPMETVKEYKRSFEDVIWPALMHEFEWTRVIGPRPTDNYFMPKGVVRGQNGARCREDFFDSHRQVIKHMVENECRFRHILERAWDSAVAKPRPPAKPATSKQKRKKAPRQRQSAMMEKEYPKKVSQVGAAHQVDPANLCPSVSKEEYVPPEDVEFEQVWAPLPLLPNGKQSQAPEELVREFADVVSQDKCLEILYRCSGDLSRARATLNNLLRMWRAKYPDATSASRATTAAREVVERETLAMHQTMASASATASAAGVALGVEVGSFLRRGAQRQLQGGEAALRRQVEGGLSCRPPGTRSKDKLPLDLNLARPWSCGEAEIFTRVLLEESVKNFSAVQKALPDRQVCELVDRYYGGWKQMDSYRKLKGTISLAKLQSVCWVCQTGGDLMCCEGCDAVYHISCVGLTTLPEGDWFCLSCIKTKKTASVKEIQGTGTDSAAPPQPEVYSLGSGAYSTRDKRKRYRPGGSGEGSGASKNLSAKDVVPAGSSGDHHSPPGVVKSDQTGANASCAARRVLATPGVIERVPILLGSSQSRGSQPQEELKKREEREREQEQKKQKEKKLEREQEQHVPESSSPARASSSKTWKRSKVVTTKLSKESDASTSISCSKPGEVNSAKLAPSSPETVPACESRASPDACARSDSTDVSTGVDVAAASARDDAGEATTAHPAEPEKTEQEWWLCMTCSIFNQGRCCRLCSGPKPADEPEEDDDMGDDEDEDIEVDVVAVGMGPGEAVTGGMFGRGAVPTASFALALPPA